MRQIAALISLIFYAGSILFTYVASRQKWLRWQIAGVSGFVFGAIFLFLFGVLQGMKVTDALALGFGLTALFTITMISMSIFFDVNSRGRPPRDDQKS